MQACHNFFNFSNVILEAVPEVGIFHFEDGGDVTNPAGLSPCILPGKGKSGPMPPSSAKHLQQNPANPALFPRMSPGSPPPPGWPLISAKGAFSSINFVKRGVLSESFI